MWTKRSSIQVFIESLNPEAAIITHIKWSIILHYGTGPGYEYIVQKFMNVNVILTQNFVLYIAVYTEH